MACCQLCWLGERKEGGGESGIESLAEFLDFPPGIIFLLYF
jgi:hypothetical protein